MKIEAILIELGDRPLRKSAYSKVLGAVLNAYLPGDSPVNDTMNGQELLAKIYQLNDVELQEKILEKQLGAVRNTDMYRNVVLIFAVIVGMTTVLIAMTEILSAGSPTGASTDNLTKIVIRLIELFEKILTK